MAKIGHQELLRVMKKRRLYGRGLTKAIEGRRASGPHIQLKALSKNLFKQLDALAEHILKIAIAGVKNALE